MTFYYYEENILIHFVSFINVQIIKYCSKLLGGIYFEVLSFIPSSINNVPFLLTYHRQNYGYFGSIHRMIMNNCNNIKDLDFLIVILIII